MTTDPSTSPLGRGWPSVNALAAPLVTRLIQEAQRLRLGIERMDNGCVVVDGGIDVPGGLEAGHRIAEICLAGLGQVGLQTTGPGDDWPWTLVVHTSHPVLACLGSQYAGWSLSHGEGKQRYSALGSGPGRAVAAKEELFGELGYRDRADTTCLVLA